MSLVVRVIAPTGRDAELICSVLKAEGVPAAACGSDFLHSEAASSAPIGPLLIAEEVLHPDAIEALGGLVQNQPSWSDLPIPHPDREAAATPLTRAPWSERGYPWVLPSCWNGPFAPARS